MINKFYGGSIMAPQKTANTAAKKQELVTEDMSFMEGMSGEGFEDMGANATSIAYLGLVQPDSSVSDDSNPAGTWRNSASGKNYGDTVKVVPVAFRTIWSERESDPPFRTVGRYPVNGIDVEIKQPPKGKRGYPKMINPETGNEVQELFVYAVILPDYPEDGILYFNPTVGSMKSAKAWNSQLKSQLLPNGVQAPIFAFQWNLIAELVPNPQQPTKQITKFTKAIRDSIVNKELFTETVQPTLASVKQNVLQLTSGILDEPVEEE